MSENTNNRPDTAAQNKKGQKPGGIGRTVKRLTLIVILGVAVITGVIVYLARSEPAYWKEHQRFLSETTPDQIEQLAKQVDVQLENLASLGLDEAANQTDAATRSLRSLTGTDATANANNDGNESIQSNIQPEDVHINIDQTVILTNDQLAAVVQTRMDDWMNERGYVKPNEIADPMITVDKGDLVMAFSFQAGGLSTIISGKFDLKIRDDGMAVLSMKRFLVGQLPVPVDAIGEHLRQQSGGDERAAQIGQWLEKLQHMEFKPVIELDHRRRARVQDYQLLDHGLELTVRVQDHKTYKSMNRVLASVPVD